MKKLVLAALVLLVLVGAAVLVGPSFVDWNSYKTEIAEAVEDQTGRKLAIDGDIGFQVLPAPRLSVERLRLANAEGGTGDTFVSVGALQIHVAFAPLLQGKIKVASVTLKDPVIRLEQFADGSNNWTFGDKAAASGSTADSTGGSASVSGDGLDLTLDGATIVNGRVSFIDHASGAEHSISGLDATLSAQSLDGPFKATSRLVYQNLPLSISAATGKVDAGKATALEAVISVGDNAAELSFGGTLVLDDRPRAMGTVTASGADLVAAGNALPPLGLAEDSVPAALKGPFKLSAKLHADPARVSVSDLAVTAAKMSAEGEITAELSEPLAIDASLAVDRFSLDETIATFGGAAAPAAAANEPSAGPAGEPGSFELPSGIDANLTLTADAIDYRGGVIRQPRIEMALSNRVLVLKVLSAQMPGGSDLSVSGTLESADGKPQFAGRADFVSDNLRGALAWVGTELDGIAADRLRKGSLGADIAATPEQVKLSNWTMDLDTTRVRGGLTLLLRERPAFGLALNLGKINLDAYLPPEGAANQAGNAGADQQASSAGPTPMQQVAVALNTFDANIVVNFEEILIRQTAVIDGKIDATIQNGALQLRNLSIADLGGARVNLSGSLAGLVADPNTKLNFEIDAKSAARLARLAGIAPDETLQRVGAVTVAGSILGDFSNLTVDASVRAVGGNASVKGVVQPLALPTGIDLALKLQHPDADRLVETLSPGTLPSDMTLGSLALAASVANAKGEALGIDATMDLGGGQLGVKGTVDPSGALPKLALDTRYAHPDVVALIRSLSPGYTPEKRDLGPVKLETRLEGTTEQLAFNGIKLGAGPLSLTGNAALALKEPRPKLTLAAETGTVAIDPWLPRGTARPSGGVAPAVPLKSGARAWSRETIDTSGLLAADADISLKAKQVQYGAYILDNVDLAAALENGTLTVSRLKSGLFGGSVDGTASLKHGATPTAGLTLTVRNADVRQAAMSASEAAQVTGTLDYETALQTSGRSEFALVSGLQGTGKISVREGTVEGFDLPAVSEQLKALDRSVDFLVLAQKAMRGGTTPFESLTGSYTITDGVLRSEDISLKSKAAEGRGTAVVNLPPQEMDVNTQFWLSEHPNSPPIGLRMVGPLNNPRQVLDANKMQAFVLQRIVERGILRQFNKNQDSTGQDSGTTTPDASPSEPVRKLAPEKALQGVLKGLLGN
ncbi:AsmA family protein [Nisaea acidiphila]|uniref:AsmA family protein n=1 Tax=Nisaea acidiphila TaxID=1862145 RepID=A0A9J7AYB4_9PROT|nr:AsmA family protein [Nisaea acidiphila]UUX51786.1 AsmA family protein [Nisaea acidiphila]